jgi:hypothetical protein
MKGVNRVIMKIESEAQLEIPAVPEALARQASPTTAVPLRRVSRCSLFQHLRRSDLDQREPRAGRIGQFQNRFAMAKAL